AECEFRDERRENNSPSRVKLLRKLSLQSRATRFHSSLNLSAQGDVIMIRDAWKSRLLHLVAFSLLLVVAAPRVLAQAGATGAISGTVLDSSGALIPGAEVRIVDNRTAQPLRTLTTDSSGKFVAALLPPSTYSAVVNAKGFGEQVTSGIEVRVTETTRISVSLRPSQR